MPLLRFETDQETPSRPLIAALQRVRDEFVDSQASDFDDAEALTPRLPETQTFFSMPEQQLLAYERYREASELGHVFRIANHTHDYVDALVVVGSVGDVAGGEALFRACCDPYHNELDRAARGSKPRVYFVDDELDNDQLQSLLNRLAVGGYGDSAAETGWALIAAGNASPVHGRPVLQHLLHRNRIAGGEMDSGLKSRLVTPIGDAGFAAEISKCYPGCGERLRVSSNLVDGWGVLTPLGLLPSAFLGLDCIQLLVGAAAVNANFRSEPFATNLVLHFLAANGFVGPNGLRSSIEPSRQFAWWARSLAGLDRWRRTLPRAERRWDSETADLATDFARSHVLRQLERGHRTGGSIICNHVVVDAIRTDPLPIAPAGSVSSLDDSSALPQLHRDQLPAIRRQLEAVGVRQNLIRLPVIDTHSLGQLLQLLMLAAAIESEVAAGRIGSGV
ncbi:hypothetical protein NZK35_26465 [Stieleria sp. ICT_E10.1]|uniref:hypothetical protein n=1 Tax=Stieleria sedimenti TaxID=2976331 RepID=UPI00218004FF|nr:hypothetical protein [Stieleria sedimenti]MCS7470206.1 hypothetical protein [Stieleria sedimenti]